MLLPFLDPPKTMTHGLIRKRRDTTGGAMTDANRTTLPEAVPLPTARTTPFDPPPVLADLRAAHPVSRLRFPDGHIGWLVTSHEIAREVLSDRRFSSHNEMRRPVVRLPVADDRGLRPMMSGTFIAMDPPDHTRYRRLLNGQFSSRRMQMLEPRITAIVNERLDAMERIGPPLDLVSEFSAHIPPAVICELFGVPPAEREIVRRHSATLVRLEATPEEAKGAWQSLMDFLLDLIRRKRVDPGDDLISGLIASGELNSEEMAGVSFLILFGGHETTANMLGLGMFALLSNPDQLAALRADASLIDGAIDELLRYLSVVQLGTVRGALEDVELHGQRIKAGESVCVSLPTVNRDPTRFDHPDDLILTRPPGGHLAFGHGVHRCLGEPLARVELRIGYTELLRRFPTLRLATGPENVPMRSDMIIYGVHELPIEWNMS